MSLPPPSLCQQHELDVLCAPNAAVISAWTFTAVPLVSGANVTATKYWTIGDPAQVGWAASSASRSR